MIDSFSGKHHFLSNFSSAEVWLDGESYPSTEHAYQAAKTMDKYWRRQIRDCATPNEAKKLGRRVPMHPKFHEVKDEVMYQLVRQKFMQHPELSSKLLDTGDQELVEGNWWGDQYWGVSRGVGRNQLGKTLMRVRDELKAKIEA